MTGSRFIANVFKTGNSLAIVIPFQIARIYGIDEGDGADMMMMGVFIDAKKGKRK